LVDQRFAAISRSIKDEQRWGRLQRGLRCRLATAKAQVPMGAKVDFQLHLRFDSDTWPDDNVNLLNRCDQAFNATLTFTDTKTGNVFRRSPYDAGMTPPGPDTDDIVQLRKDPLATPDRLEVHLLSGKGEQIPAGDYHVVATYENTAEPEVEVSVAPDGLLLTRPYEGPWEFWKGKIESAPMKLTITPAKPKQVELKANSALVVKQEQRDGQTLIGWTWSQGEPKVIRVERRPGYILGRRYGLQVFLDGKPVGEPDDYGGLTNAVWGDGKGMSYLAPELANRVLAGEKLKLVVNMEVFETSMPTQHFWSPESGDYRVLWRGLIEGTLPAAKEAAPAIHKARERQQKGIDRKTAVEAFKIIEQGGNTPEPLKSEPNSFTIALPDGRKMKVSPDMTRFKHSPTADINEIQRACERTVGDARQNGIPIRDRNIRILVDVKSAHFDEKTKKWVRYQHEPRPVFDVLKIGELGTVEFEPRVAQDGPSQQEPILQLPRLYGDTDVKAAGSIDSGWSKPVNGLRARLICDEKTFVLGKPMEIMLELECFGEKDYEFPEKPLRRCQLLPHVDVYAKHLDGVKAAPRTPLNIPNRLVIVKGRTFRQSFDVASLLDIKEPGKYVLAAGHSNGDVEDIGDWTGKVLSPPLAVEVVEKERAIPSKTKDIPFQEVTQ
jgi:hypothetical protein